MKDKMLQTIPIFFELKEMVDDRFSFVNIYLMHTGLNLNGSVFFKDIVEKSFDSLKNTPILGFVKIEDGVKDFDGHKNILVVDNGEYKLKYAGQAYGVIPETCNPRWEFRVADDGVEREYLVCDGVLWSAKFSDIKDIFGDNPVKRESMELHDSFSGYYDEDENFVFTDFLFYGACVLGENKKEAMTGATVELKFDSDTYIDTIQEQMELLKFTLSQYHTSKDIDDINNNQEGGTVFVDEKLELLAKYNINPEQLDFSIEDLSLEELELKIKPQDEPENNFSLSNNVFINEIQKLLNEVTEVKTNRWGETWTTLSYYLMDVKDEFVVVVNNNWDTYYGIPFAVEGDTVTMSFDSKIEFIPDWRAKEANESVSITAFNEYLNAEFDVVDKNIDELKSKIESYETENSNLQINLEEANGRFSAIEEEAIELRQFKNNVIMQDRLDSENALFEIFSEKLTEEELITIKETSKDFTIEELEDKLYAMVARKIVKFSTQTKKTKLDFEFDSMENNEVPNKFEKPYAHRIKEYQNKK